MEITTTNIYWPFAVLGNIKGINEIVVVTCIILLLFTLIAGLFSWNYENSEWKESYIRWVLILFIFIFTFVTLFA